MTERTDGILLAMYLNIIPLSEFRKKGKGILPPPAPGWLAIASRRQLRERWGHRCLVIEFSQTKSVWTHSV